ncbi:MAG: exonuclease domain-containing protein [Phascolarctobacterium sp.]|nr:exonuclease domain-containing protein [Phascolarctobacterium sp.]
MRKFLLVDFEFTTYTRPVGRPSAYFSEIIEIGALLLDGETFKEMARYQSFVKPRFYPKQAKDSMDFCMITEKDMKKAAEFPDMVKKLGEMYVPGETYFVAWGDSDFKVLDTACKRYKVENPISFADYLDLAEAYKLMKGDSYTTRLKAATEEQEVDTAGLWHTAFDDANNTGKLLHKLVEKGWKPEEYFEAKEGEN